MNIATTSVLNNRSLASDSTISGNLSSSSAGGGLNNESIADVANNTFSGNLAATEGGAIVNSGTLGVTNSTIARNLALGSGSAGIKSEDRGMVRVKSSIIALNTNSGDEPDVQGVFRSSGFNLIGNRDGSVGFVEPTDQTGNFNSPLDPKLDPAGLKDNGGETPTID